ncbi:PRC-barrel domain-containing protein [Chroococcidiopsis sp. FACHB-1243]|uniref:PRC-barrel domain-containing protein n=1 Tax=Chroococcidiopsis sp. [FACHB-1243] TaxID=2692781 RepID=UPI00177FBCB7|nr:PRC-barrel domain-containing protein [Chroococcidiopsis sp. [FACHB-1243]]MBD2307717.1 PRC-barrel domain-containing protein [Chroococcidiopsis sp. [FACHB-1243]]
MALLKLKDIYPQMASRIEDNSITGFTVYTNKDEKIGTVKGILVDEDTGKFQYLIIDLGLWIFGKEVLLPIERARVRAIERRVDAEGLTKKQAENLPEFNDDLKLDRDYEVRVSNAYRPANNNPSIQPAPIAAIDPIVLNTTATLSKLT